MGMNNELVEKYFKISYQIKEEGAGIAISEIRVKNIIANILSLKTPSSVQNNLDFLVIKKFLVRGSMGNIFVNPDLDKSYALWKSKFGDGK